MILIKSSLIRTEKLRTSLFDISPRTVLNIDEYFLLRDPIFTYRYFKSYILQYPILFYSFLVKFTIIGEILYKNVLYKTNTFQFIFF